MGAPSVFYLSVWTSVDLRKVGYFINFPEWWFPFLLTCAALSSLLLRDNISVSLP